MKNDESGSSSLTTLIILIVIGLLVWQFVLPEISDEYSSFSDFLTTPEVDITGNWGLRNTATGEEWTHPLSINEIDYSNTDAFDIKVYTNAPYKTSNPYYIDIEVWEGGNQIFSLTEPIPASGLFSDTFTYTLGVDYNEAKDYSVEVKLLDSEKLDTNKITGIIFLMG